MPRKISFTGKDIVSVRDFSRNEIDYILKISETMEPVSKSGTNILNGKIMGTLFFEPSTRTKLSFETAMKRLGGDIIGFNDRAMSSVDKGETLIDTIRVVENYVDIIVLRHPSEGSARLAADYASIPVINAGSGSGEHPTQAFLDLYTIHREKGKIDGLNVGILGDLRYSRTVHSLAYAFSLYNLTLHLISPETLRMRKEVLKTVKTRIKVKETNNIEDSLPNLDVLYVTRIQKERFPDPSEYEKVKGTYKVDTDILRAAKRDLIVMHPLPRTDEIT
ncbi:MAG: aspartate carbamoyltransferase, partial [Candidatus Bathyarchaeota archaeon]